MNQSDHVRLLIPDGGSRLRVSRAATVAALTMASAAETWTTSGVSLSLTDLTGTLSASSDEASWALTVYMAAFAVSVALSHRLSVKFGNRRYLTMCAALYALSSIGCALSSSLAIFLFFRTIAGFAGGVFLVRAFVFFTQEFEPSVRAKPLIGYAIAYFFVGRFLSPIICGWLADLASWRLLFLLPTILMLISAFLFSRFSADHWMEEDARKPLDYIGIVFLVLGAACLQTALSRGEVEGWFESPQILAIALAGLGGNAFFVLWQLAPQNRYPLLDLFVLRHATARAAAVLGFLIGVLLAGSLYVLPLYLRNIETHSALQSGVLLSIGGAASVLVLCGFRPVVALFSKIGGGAVLLVSLFVEIGSQLLFAHYLTPDTPDRFLWIPLALNGIFIALSVPTLGIVAFANIKNDQASNARAMYYGCRQFGASIGITCASVLIDRRMSLHSSRLLDIFANRDDSLVDRAGAMTDRAIAVAVHRQSSVLGYADVFYGMTAVAIITLFFVPLLPPVAADATPEKLAEGPDTDPTSIRPLGATR